MVSAHDGIPRVFVSSTDADLKEYRVAARDAALGADCKPELHDYWTAKDNPPLDECLAQVAKSAALVVIVAHRHGWVPKDAGRNPDGKSITRLECEQAVELGIPVFAFLLDDGADWPEERREAYALTKAMENGNATPELLAQVQARIDGLKAFKSWLNDRAIRKTFTDPKDLKGKVEATLRQWRASPTQGPAGHPPPVQSLIVPEAYRDWLRGECIDLTVSALHLKQGQALRLSHVYVPAIVAAAPGQAAEPPDRVDIRGKDDDKPRLLLSLLDLNSLYVPGAPGSGKSVFFHWLALATVGGRVPAHPVEAPEDYRETLPETLAGRLPLWLPLRSFWPSLPAQAGELTRGDLEKALYRWLEAEHAGRLAPATAQAYLEQGRALLILDGVDEVPRSHQADDTNWHPRAALLSGLAKALPAWRRAGNRVLLTSRPYGLEGPELQRLKLAQAQLAPLNDDLQALFARRWYTALDGSEAGQAKAGELERHVSVRSDIGELLESPMLLTAVCVLFGDGGRLPEDKLELYDRLVDYVLYNRYPESAGDRRRIRERLGYIASGMHTGQGLDEARQSPEPEASQAQLEQLLRAFAQESPSTERGVLDSAAHLEELLSHTGLLLPAGRKRAAFYHFSFQEFLAAERLAVLAADEGSEAWYGLFLRWGNGKEWRYTLDFLFGAYLFRHASTQAGIRLLGRLIDTLSLDKMAGQANLAWTLADCLDIALAKGALLPEEKLDRFRQVCLAAVEQEIRLQPRQALGLSLGRIGDPRILAPRDPRGYVIIPAGRYPFQDGWIEVEEAFALSRYPVTNGQFQRFVEAGGYQRREYWSEGGLAWLEEEKASAPRSVGDHRFGAPNQPVVGVSWWEAEAYCHWAGGRLPSEREWEAAARGSKPREYPWEGDWEDGICNSLEAGLGRTSPVGLFPRARQADFGLEDMAGNAWEWCADVLPKDELPDFLKGEPGGARVLRGGGWNDPAGLLRATSRLGIPAGYRNRDFGFRVAVAPANTLARAHVPMPPCRSLPGAMRRNLPAHPFW